ncbi:ParA family protein [Kitasatospora sp. NPDC101801]|uniref:ParA family protein n=1 Tax=Kitasatospora sp. NPDC101801 TaxID=3364103 RepID=UPI00382D68AA
MPQVEQVEPPPWDGPPLIVVLWGGKGGIGKSTLAFLLAWSLGKVGRTLLLDADPEQKEGNAQELYDLLELPATFDFASEDDPAKLAGLRRARQYRFIVIDNAPHRDREILKTTCDGDLIVVPLPLDYLEARAIMSSIREIVIPTGHPYRVVMSKVDAARKAKAVRTLDTLDLAGIPVFRTHMRELVAHQDAGQMGIPITEGTSKTWHKPGKDALDLADEVLAALGLADRVPRPAWAVEKVPSPRKKTTARTRKAGS